MFTKASTYKIWQQKARKPGEKLKINWFRTSVISDWYCEWLRHCLWLRFISWILVILTFLSFSLVMEQVQQIQLDWDHTVRKYRPNCAKCVYILLRVDMMSTLQKYTVIWLSYCDYLSLCCGLVPLNIHRAATSDSDFFSFFFLNNSLSSLLA